MSPGRTGCWPIPFAATYDAVEERSKKDAAEGRLSIAEEEEEECATDEKVAHLIFASHSPDAQRFHIPRLSNATRLGEARSEEAVPSVRLETMSGGLKRGRDAYGLA